MPSASTYVVRQIRAPRARVYAALIDRDAVARWMVPTGMSGQVHSFDPREGGSFRISLTYEEPTGTGKTTEHTDTYHGYFEKLRQDEQVVEVMEFESPDPLMGGEMRVTMTLSDSDGGTELVALHEDLPPGIRPEDNETGWRMSLDKLAALLEAESQERA